MILQNVIINKYGEFRGGKFKWKRETPKHVKQIWKGLINEKQGKLFYE